MPSYKKEDYFVDLYGSIVNFVLEATFRWDVWPILCTEYGLTSYFLCTIVWRVDLVTPSKSLSSYEQ